MNWFKKLVAAVLVAGTLCAPVTVYAADDTTAITATAETQSTSMYVNKKCYSYDSPNAGRKQLELIYSGTKITVVGEKGQYYKLDVGSYVMKKYVGETCTNWTTFKYKTAKTMYAANNVVLRKKALSNGAKVGSVKAGQKLTVIGYTNTGYSKLDNGSYILTKYLNTSATSWRYYKYSKPVTMYATKSVIIRSKALGNAPKTGSVKADQKLTVVGYTNTGFYKLNNGKYIKTTYATKTKPVTQNPAANPASDFTYEINNGTVTITKYVGTDTTAVIPSIIDGKPVTVIGEEAFYWCTNLTSVVIPDSVTIIGDRAFSDCESLASVVIPDSVTIIGEWAFSCCQSLTSVVIPDSMTIIGEWAFFSCYNLTSVVIPDSVTKIGDKAFYLCTSLKSVVIPDSVTEIGDETFSCCNSLTSAVIPNSVTKIGYDAFYYCENLKSVVIPDSVTEIGSNAFSMCTSLTSVVIPDSVTKIGMYAFDYCESLKSVVIPDSVTALGKNAFSGCNNITVTYKGKTYTQKNMKNLYSLF